MDTLRGGAVVAVVAMHAELVVVGETGRQLPPVHALNDLLGEIRMPLLVLLSGLLLPRSLAKGLREHVRGKVVHILWPYAVWGLLDCTHAVLDARLHDRPVPWQLYRQLLHDPHTYLWFLAYLFVFHLAAGLMPLAARVVVLPVTLVAAGLFPAEHSLHKLLWLFGFFLLGDLLARGLAARVPSAVARAGERLSWAPLAVVGRQSVVYYACHLLVLIEGVRLLHAAGVTHPPALFATSVALALAVGALLVHLRPRPAVGWLFSCPRAPGPSTAESPARAPARV